MGIEVLEVGPERAGDVLAVVHAAFRDRPVLDPPATALDETEGSIRAALADHGGLMALQDGEPVGALLFAPHDGLLGVRRVGVLPSAQGLGVASLLADRAAEVAVERGFPGLVLAARAELPATVRFWQGHGYFEIAHDGTQLTLARLLPVTATLARAEDTQAVGERLAGLLAPGDLVILTGDLGAGKTTLTQGIGVGLGVRGGVTSPTFVIARIHPPLAEGPELVHVDAYRLGGAAELDDLDLDTDLDEAVTVVEWGEGLAEALASDRLEVRLERADDDVRTLTLTPLGARWIGVDLAGVLRTEVTSHRFAPAPK